MFESKLHLTVEPFNSVHNAQIIRLQGEFDKLGLASVKDELEKIIEGFSGKYLIFDLGDLSFINSEGIGYLIGVYTHLVNAGGVFCLVGAKDHVKDVFEALGLWNVIKHADSIEACYSL